MLNEPPKADDRAFRLKPEPQQHVIASFVEMKRMARAITFAAQNLRPLTRQPEAIEDLDKIVGAANEIEELSDSFYKEMALDHMAENAT